jgi:biotin carboxyl carrier protein
MSIVIENKSETDESSIDRIVEDLARIRKFDGPPSEFWPEFLKGCSRLVAARVGVLLLRGEDDESWKNMSSFPAGGIHILKHYRLTAEVEGIAESAAIQGAAWQYAHTGAKDGSDGLVLGVRLDLEDEKLISVAIFFIQSREELDAETYGLRLKLVADIPAGYQAGRIMRQAKNDVVQFAEALDLMVLLDSEKRYVAAAMTFCNELASRYRCSRVSLGWLKGKYIRVQTISHMEQFEKKMDAVQILEAAMEEAFDQDEEIVWPKPPDNTSVVKDHETLSRELGMPYILSVPIRLEGEPMGILTCERAMEPFSEAEISGFRLLCDQGARRLGDLKRRDRWFGARLGLFVRESLSKLFGTEHTFAKLIGLLLSIALFVLLFGKMNYRVESSFILKTDDLVYLPAPFEGYIDKVPLQVGDRVDKGDVLLSFDIQELLLEESTAIANQIRYRREAEKARAQNALAEMKIAKALEDQGKAQLDLVRYRLRHAELKAPFAGIVVEGDLKELLGAPVRKGDVLFKVARIEKMYAELEVEERDIHEVAVGMTGEIAFVSRPDIKFPIRIERIDPVAVTKEEGSVFTVRGVFTADKAGWWRPGMSGVSKINVGDRNILWILTHRTIDFLRILLWW